MTDRSTKIFSIKMDLESILEKILGIEDDNFNESINDIEMLAQQVNIKKSDLIAQLAEEDKKKISLEFEEITKKIKCSFDNIVEEKAKEIEKVRLEINKLTNQKKLALYKR